MKLNSGGTKNSYFAFPFPFKFIPALSRYGSWIGWEVFFPSRLSLRICSWEKSFLLFQNFQICFLLHLNASQSQIQFLCNPKRDQVDRTIITTVTIIRTNTNLNGCPEISVEIAIKNRGAVSPVSCLGVGVWLEIRGYRQLCRLRFAFTHRKMPGIPSHAHDCGPCEFIHIYVYI